MTLLDTHDIVFVQELWLHDHQMHLLHSLSDEFVVYARSGMARMAVAVQHQILRGRPYGGVAVFMCKTLSSCITYDDEARVICVRYTSASIKLLLFGCYFPFNDHSADYPNRVADVLGFIENVCNDYPGFNICILGDCNFECDVSHAGYNIFADFADRCNLVSCDSLSDSENAYTYHHEGLGHKSYIDHVFISCVLKQYVRDYEILDNVLNTSDHLPISFCLMVPCNAYQAKVHSKNSNIIRDYRWDKGNIDAYYYETGNELGKLVHIFPCENSDSLCDHVSHLTDIDIYYNEIVFALKRCADSCIPKVPKSCMKHYWSVALDDLKQSSIDTYNMWASAGKPRQGILFDYMKDAKYKYKLAVRDVIHVYENKFSDDLYDHMLSKDMSNFWKTWSRKT